MTQIELLLCKKGLDNLKEIKYSFLQRDPRTTLIGTKWVFRNKPDESGNVVRKKSRLVAKGYNQEEDIDFDETFAHLAHLEAICIFLASASYMGIKLFQKDVECSFLNGFLQEEVYVEHVPSFKILIFLIICLNFKKLSMG